MATTAVVEIALRISEGAIMHCTAAALLSHSTSIGFTLIGPAATSISYASKHLVDLGDVSLLLRKVKLRVVVGIQPLEEWKCSLREVVLWLRLPWLLLLLD